MKGKEWEDRKRRVIKEIQREREKMRDALKGVWCCIKTKPLLVSHLCSENIHHFRFVGTAGVVGSTLGSHCIVGRRGGAAQGRIRGWVGAGVLGLQIPRGAV